MDDATKLQYELLIDYVCELMGRQFKKSQIIRDLQENYTEMPKALVGGIIRAAREKIRRVLNINPDEYRGRAIEFYSSIMRNDKASLKYRISAAHELDQITGVHTSEGSHEEYARLLRAAVAGIQDSVPKDDTEPTSVDEEVEDAGPDPFEFIVETMDIKAGEIVPKEVEDDADG